MNGMPELDVEVVRHALGVARKNGYVEVEISIGEDSFIATLDLKKSANRPSAGSSATITLPTESLLKPIKATLVGYYREANNPLTPGQIVQRGDLVAVIAALGIANDIEAPLSGEVVEVLVSQDQPVEYGQILAMVQPL